MLKGNQGPVGSLFNCVLIICSARSHTSVHAQTRLCRSCWWTRDTHCQLVLKATKFRVFVNKRRTFGHFPEKYCVIFLFLILTLFSVNSVKYCSAASGFMSTHIVPLHLFSPCSAMSTTGINWKHFKFLLDAQKCALAHSVVMVRAAPEQKIIQFNNSLCPGLLLLEARA